MGGMAPLESADDKFLFYTKPTDPGLWRTPLSGGQKQQLFSDAVVADGAVYAPRRKGIYFIRQAGPVGAVS
jgi:hypothetical protein